LTTKSDLEFKLIMNRKVLYRFAKIF